MTIATTDTPRFKHNNDESVFLGLDGKADLYFDPRANTCVVARFSDRDCDYSTLPCALAAILPAPHLSEALARARKSSLTTHYPVG